VNSDVKVYEGWLNEIREAFKQYEGVGTVSVLSNAGSILSVPLRNLPIDESPVENLNIAIAESIRGMSLKLFPIIPTPVGHVLGIDTRKWNELGGFNEIYSPGYGEEVDLGERMCMKGYLNILADSVWVTHKQSASFGNDPRIRKMREDHESIVKGRFSAYGEKTSFAATNQRSALSQVIYHAYLIFFGTSNSKINETIFSYKTQQAQSIYSAIHSIKPMIVNTIKTSMIGTHDLNINDGEFNILLVDKLDSVENQYTDLNDELWKQRRDSLFYLFQEANSIVWRSVNDFTLGRGIFGERTKVQSLILAKNENPESRIPKLFWFSNLLPVTIIENTSINAYSISCNACENDFCEHVISSAFLIGRQFQYATSRANQPELLNAFDIQYRNSGKIGKIILILFSKYSTINRVIIPIGSRRRSKVKKVTLFLFSEYRKIKST
jgi:hypothetical protein